jgi:3-oxoacyl-(acyl-carrier-protein) synthase
MNRRKFLQVSAAGLALSALGSYAAEFADQKKRVGLIGCGWYGKCDLLRLIQVAPVEVVSLCDVDKQMLAGAADEVYDQMFWNYDYMKYLWPDADAEAYRLRSDDANRKVVGEGAAVFVMESLEDAKARGAVPLAEVLGYGMGMDTDAFEAPSLLPDGLLACCRRALLSAAVTSAEVDLIVWAPQGNRQDDKTVEALRGLLGPDLGGIPMVTTTFNTGYLESALILTSLAAVLIGLKQDGSLWPQKTGAAWLDERRASRPIRQILALGSSDTGGNYALVLRAGVPV